VLGNIKAWYGLTEEEKLEKLKRERKKTRKTRRKDENMDSP
jgi:hypothetical protein